MKIIAKTISIFMAVLFAFSLISVSAYAEKSGSQVGATKDQKRTEEREEIQEQSGSQSGDLIRDRDRDRVQDRTQDCTITQEVAESTGTSETKAAAPSPIEDSLELVFEGLEVGFPPLIESLVADLTISIEGDIKGNDATSPADRHNSNTIVRDASGTITLTVVDMIPPLPIDPIVLEFEVDLGIISEHGEGENESSNAIDLFFRAKSLVISGGLTTEPVTLENVLIKIHDGKIQFVIIGDSSTLLAPSKNKVRITSFGAIKSN